MSEETDSRKMESDLSEAIARNASGPKSAEADGRRVEQHPLSSMVEAARYLDARRAAKSRSCGLKFSRLCPPGA